MGSTEVRQASRQPGWFIKPVITGQLGLIPTEELWQTRKNMPQTQSARGVREQGCVYTKLWSVIGSVADDGGFAAVWLEHRVKRRP